MNKNDLYFWCLSEGICELRIKNDLFDSVRAFLFWQKIPHRKISSPRIFPEQIMRIDCSTQELAAVLEWWGKCLVEKMVTLKLPVSRESLAKASTCMTAEISDLQHLPKNSQNARFWGNILL